MVQAVTAVEAWVREIDEPLSKRYTQWVTLSVSGANTDVTYDFGLYVAGSLGTFWTAAGGAGVGATALSIFQQISTLEKTYMGVVSPSLMARTRQGVGSYITLVSSAITSGGSATPTATVTGLLSTDVVAAVTQSTVNANSLPLLAYGAAGAGSIGLTYSADPGNNGKVTVFAYRPTGTAIVQAGSYAESVSNATSNILYVSGDAPTTATYIFSWDLQNNTHGIKYSP